MTTQGGGALSSLRQSSAFRTVSRASTLNLPAGQGEGGHAAGGASSSWNPSAPTQPRRANVVLFGETGVGKSSVVNLIAQHDVAKVSLDVNGCTMQSTRYDISFDGMDFSIFDTMGLEEPQMGINGYLRAIEKAYELTMKLGAAGGIHLLLFCMRGGRITATTQSNYRLFCECLCSTKVPMALVFTGLEREEIMEDWWERNKRHVEYYGINSDGHACITALQDETSEDHKYEQSQMIIRDLLKKCVLKSDAFLPEPHSWFAMLVKGMRSFVEKQRSPKQKDVVKVLTRRCKLDPETARKIADIMERGDAEENWEPVGGPSPEESARKDPTEVESGSLDVLGVKDHDGAANERATRNGLSAPPQNDGAAGPHDVELDGNYKGAVADERRERQRASWLLQSEVEIQHPTVRPEAKGDSESRVVDENAAKHLKAKVLRVSDIIREELPRKRKLGEETITNV